MKRLTSILLLAAALASNLSAHHNSPSDNAGGNMSDNSGHLNLVFG